MVLRQALQDLRKEPIGSGPKPDQAAFLFIQMDDDGLAYTTLCADEPAVLEAVINACWVKGTKLDEEELGEAFGILGTLLEDGRMTFEGDPPLHLFRLAPGQLMGRSA